MYFLGNSISNQFSLEHMWHQQKQSDDWQKDPYVVP